jgi:hypothetical protein
METKAPKIRLADGVGGQTFKLLIEDANTSIAVYHGAAQTTLYIDGHHLKQVADQLESVVAKLREVGK